MFGAAPQVAAAAAALGLEGLVGYPDAVFRAVRHPVMWIGWALDQAERRLNAGRHRRAKGVAAVIALVAGVAAPAALLQHWLPWFAVAVLATPFLAQRSLHTHVQAVAAGLAGDGLAGGRLAVSHIVGRDPASLDEAGVVRAAIESLAENFSDGIVAPAVWTVAAGLPGLVAYKAVNTADSMIGHRSPRYAQFGWAAARLDDLVNLPGSRLAAVWLVLAACLLPGASPAGALRAVLRDARHHRSPNAGWPEAAMAGALGLRLAGPRVYGGVLVQDGWMGNGRSDAGIADLRRALALYRTACLVQFTAVTLLALIVRG